MRAGAVPSMVQQAGRGCWIEQTGAATAGNVGGIWINMLKIRLTDLHPMFKELNLVANPQLKLRCRVNAGTTVVTATGTDQFALTSTTMTLGSVCPITLAGGAAGETMNGVLSGTSALTIAFGPLQNAITPTATIAQYLPYTTTRLHIPFYDLTDPRPIISKAIKTVRYLDGFAQYFKQRAGLGVINGQQNASFNFQLSASLKNVKYLAMFPFAETSAGHWATAHGTTVPVSI